MALETGAVRVPKNAKDLFVSAGRCFDARIVPGYILFQLIETPSARHLSIVKNFCARRIHGQKTSDLLSFEGV